VPGAGTVLADEVAVQAAQNFLKIIEGELQAALSALRSAGNTLADPSHWAGGDATRFQSQIWPKAQADLKQIEASLADLQKQVSTVLQNILAAGGGGGVPVPGPGPVIQPL
jgi:uncharacterized protein YukE